MARVEAPTPAVFSVVERFIPDGTRTFVVKVVEAARQTPDPLRVTSWFRAPDRNARVGGSPESQHLLGLGLDIVVKGDAEEFVQTLESLGLFAVDEQNHVHVQLLPAGAARSQGLLAALGLPLTPSADRRGGRA